MWVAELQCPNGHGFEGWFGSRDDFDAQQARGLVACPECGSVQVHKRLSAPRLNLGATEPAAAASQASVTPPAPRPELSWRELVARLKAQTEDVGPRFAEEARRIHAEEAPARPIRGRASADEFQALQDEGIEVWALPGLDQDATSH